MTTVHNQKKYVGISVFSFLLCTQFSLPSRYAEQRGNFHRKKTEKKTERGFFPGPMRCRYGIIKLSFTIFVPGDFSVQYRLLKKKKKIRSVLYRVAGDRRRLQYYITVLRSKATPFGVTFYAKIASHRRDMDTIIE